MAGGAAQQGTQRRSGRVAAASKVSYKDTGEPQPDGAGEVADLDALGSSTDGSVATSGEEADSSDAVDSDSSD